jgi:hypothetical protein
MSSNTWDASSWRTSKEEAAKKTGGKRYSAGKRVSLLLKFGEKPVKVHFAMPKQLYTNPLTGDPQPFRTGYRTWVPWGGKKGNGIFLERPVDPQEDVIAAYTSPQALGLDHISPEPNFKELKNSLYYAVSGWVEEWFHAVKVLKEPGNPRGGEYLRRERCMGGKGACQHCSDGWPRVFGNRFYAAIAPSHWDNTIYRAHSLVERYCSCGGQWYTPAYVCSNCNSLLIDVCNTCDCGSSNIDFSRLAQGEVGCKDCRLTWRIYPEDNEGIAQQINSNMTCQHCQTTAPPKDYRVCSTGGAECQGKPYNIFDCQLTLRKAGSKSTDELVVDNCLIQEPDPMLFDLKYQNNDEIAVKAMNSPIDLEELLRPEDPNTQAQSLGVPNPFGAGAGAGYRQYSGPQGQQAPGQDQGGQAYQPYRR